MDDAEGTAPRGRRPLPARAVADRPFVAIGLVVMAMVVFSAQDTLSKILVANEHYHPVEVAWGRYLFFCLAMAPFAMGSRRGALRTRHLALQIGRGVCLLGSSLFFIAALVTLPMAEAIAISFISPLVVTALSVLSLRETVGIRRWSATAVGFLGILVVVRPGSASFDPAAGFPILSAICWALGLILTRRMGESDGALATLVYSSLVGLALTSLMVVLVWQAPSPMAWGLMAGTGLLSTCGHYLLVLGYMRGPASLLAPFAYVQMLSSTLAGYLAFGAVPDLGTWLGGAIIVASGLYTLHRERVVRAASR